MKILVDTNIILDALTGREPYYENADRIMKMCADKKVNGVLAAHSIPNIFYILRKAMDIDTRRKVLLWVCKILSVEGIDAMKVVAALNDRSFSDFEDCLQKECAIAAGAEFIVTRNIKDFEKSVVKAVTPEAFLLLMEDEN